MEATLAGQVALVTGAGQGAGKAIATTLATAGARVAVSDLNPDRIAQVAGEIRAGGGDALDVVADVSNKFHCVKLIEATRAAWGRLDILVNAARVEPVATVLKMDEWDWNRCLEVNLKGTFLMSQLCGRVMADAQRGGAIVNVSSVAGVEIPLENRAAFCASQAGILGFARECAREYAQYDIRVNTVLVGLAAGAPQQVADAVLFLCSAESAHTTGSTLTVDGGRLRQRGDRGSAAAG
jgi:NAD(P)-dependent dehydrogenase (short-subunit alcohol dehydrogenase family)